MPLTELEHLSSKALLKHLADRLGFIGCRLVVEVDLLGALSDCVKVLQKGIGVPH